MKSTIVIVAVAILAIIATSLFHRSQPMGAATQALIRSALVQAESEGARADLAEAEVLRRDTIVATLAADTARQATAIRAYAQREARQRQALSEALAALGETATAADTAAALTACLGFQQTCREGRALVEAQLSQTTALLEVRTQQLAASRTGSAALRRQVAHLDTVVVAQDSEIARLLRVRSYREPRFHAGPVLIAQTGRTGRLGMSFGYLGRLPLVPFRVSVSVALPLQ